jgi:UDP-GlcNAc:undecaprenyl-phosphate GlcNAc-1-phosphate transferase
MIAAAVALILLWAPHTQTVLWYLAGVGVIAVFGLWDDRSNLDYRLKFLGQLLAVLCVVFGGDIYIRFLPFNGLEPVGYWVSVPLTVFALLGITNAINLADGLDGLAGGTSFISIAVVALLAFMAEDSNLLVLCTAVLGGIVGFLRYNTHPAQVFMGDAGSQFLGFSAGVLVLILTQQTNPAISPIVPLLILGLPILDTLLVMGQRLYEGRSPFKPDKNHIHHKLLALGFDQYEAVGIIYAIQAVMVTSAVFMRYESDWLNAGCFVGLCVGILVLFRLANRLGWRAHRHRGEGSDSALARLAGAVKRSGALVRVPIFYIAVAVPGYLLYSVHRMGAVPVDAVITLSAMLAFIVLLAGFASWRPWITMIDRVVICTTITASVYYGLSGEPGSATLMSLENGLFVGLVLAIILLYRYSKSRSFKVSTMDFLVVFAVMVLPNLLGEGGEETILSEVATKAVVLYYAAELVIAQSPAQPRAVRGVLVVVLAMFVSKALLA